MWLRIPLVACLVVLLAITSTFAQEDVLRPRGRPESQRSYKEQQHRRRDKQSIILGLDAGLNINMFSQPYTLTGPTITQSPEEVLKSGSGVSPAFGVFIDVPVASSVGIQARLGYDAKWFSNTFRSVIDATITNEVRGVDGFGGIVDMETEAQASWTLNTIGAAILARVDLAPNVFITAGPIMQFQLGDLVRSDRLTKIGPDNTFIVVDYDGNPGPFDEITRETTFAQNFLPAVGPQDDGNGNPTYVGREYESMRLGLEFGIGYRHDISPTMFIAPSLRYQLMLSPLNSTFSAVEIARVPTQGAAAMSFGDSSLNSLVLAVQLGFTL